jgi:hypothetical protein
MRMAKIMRLDGNGTRELVEMLCDTRVHMRSLVLQAIED